MLDKALVMIRNENFTAMIIAPITVGIIIYFLSRNIAKTVLWVMVGVLSQIILYFLTH